MMRGTKNAGGVSDDTVSTEVVVEGVHSGRPLVKLMQIVVLSLPSLLGTALLTVVVANPRTLGA